MSDITWNMDIEDFREILQSRRTFIEEKYDWFIPDLVFDEYIELSSGLEIVGSVSQIVDNIAINGDYTEICDFIDSCDEEEEIELIKILNSGYKDETFDMLDVKEKLCDYYDFISVPFESDSNLDIVVSYFNRTMDNIFNKFHNSSYSYEIKDYECKIILEVKSKYKEELMSLNESIMSEFVYINENDSHHLGIVGFKRLTLNEDEMTASYEFDVFEFPLCYVIKSF